MPPYQSRSEARAHLPQTPFAVLRNQSQSESFEQKARLGVSPKQREARADQERLRRPPGAFATWQAAGGRAPPATSPERWGRSWASRPSRCAVAARALTPIHSDSAPQAPARASGAFSSGGRVKGLVRPAAPQGRGHGPLTRPERPKPAGRVSGRSSPAPLPSAKPPADRRRRLWACGAGGTPCLGFKGRAAPWA